MATKKDLVEAYAFSRRRLVTAFVSGAPGGREVEPSRPGRTIVGGLALAILLVAGAAVTGVFKPRVDDNWSNPGLVSSKERSTDYLILEPAEGEDPVLRPLINTTSAMLLFGADVEATSVPEAELKTLDQGPPIGILGAPGSPPDTDDLVNTGWTACTGAGLGVKTTVSDTLDVQAAPGAGFLVRSDDEYYLIAEGERGEVAAPRAYSYAVDVRGRGRLPDTAVLALSGSLPSEAVRVPARWLELFPVGGDLTVDTLGIGAIGEPVDYAGRSGIPDGARVGDYYEIGGITYVVGQDEPAELTPFAAALLQSQVGPEREITVDGSPGVVGERPYAEAHFPLDPVDQVAGELCAVLTTDETAPGVQLAQLPGETASASELDPDVREYAVESGSGAVVRSAQWDNSPGDGEGFLIDSRGQSFLLQGTDVPELLGYGAITSVFAPSAWVELFDQSVALSVDAARCPPDPQGGEPCTG